MRSLILKILIKIPNRKILLPFYHLTSDKTPTYIKHLYLPKNTTQFKKDLKTFLKHYKTISLFDLINKNKIKIKKPVFHLTFDDGLSNFYTVIAPILIKNNINATVFLNTDFVDNKDLFYRYKASLLIEHYINSSNKIKKKYLTFIEEKKIKSKKMPTVKQFLLAINYQNKRLLDDLAKQVDYSFKNFLETEKPYLTLEQIKELQKKGFTFGAHSTSHPYYASLSLEHQLKQTKDSLNWLKENLNINYKVFSFPFNDIGVTKDFFIKIKPNLDLSFGTSGIKNDEIPFNLHRLDMEKSNTSTKLFLLKNYLKYFLKMPFGKNKVKRK